MSSPVPQTAFLHEACALALRNICARLDHEREFQPYFKIDLGPPARAVHDSWDYCDMTGRYVDALALIQQVTGLEAAEEEAALRRFLARMQNPDDGLFYNQDGPNSQYVADMFCQSRVLIGLCTWFMDTHDERVMDTLRRLVHGLIRIAEYRDGYARYPRNLYRNGRWLEGGLFYQPKDLWSVKPGYGGTQLEGMMKYLALTGDGTVLSFVRQYLTYFLDAAKVVDEHGVFEGHLHSQGTVPTMVGAAMYAEATGDADLMRRCRRFLGYVLANCSTFGWVPDGIGWPTCETCAVGDVIHLAVRLSRLGEGDYWYDVERFARNQLLENQFRDATAVLAGRDAEPGLENLVIGSFASWAKPNDLLGGPDLEGCCTGGGARALFHVLDNVVGRESDGTVAVRMLFSADTEEAQVISSLPYEGRVRVTLKHTARLRLRRPEGVDAADLTVRVNGSPAKHAMEGPWLVFAELPVGAVAEMTFPTAIRTERETVAGTEYSVTRKGSTVVALEPVGAGYPTYRRERFRADSAPTAPWSFPVQSRRIRW